MHTIRLSISEARMKWDAEKAFAKLNAPGVPKTAGDWSEQAARKFPYTPPSNITPERLAQLKRIAEPVKHKGRDIESLMRYHEAHKKGRTDDDCLREKFGSVAQSAEHRPIHDKPNGPCKLEVAGSMPAAPTTPPQSADGGQPLPSAGHGKDVDTADGPWPRYFIPTNPSQSAACIFVDAHTSDVFWRGFTNKDRRLVTHNALPEAGDKRWSEVNVSAFAQWLEQNGHAKVAAEIRAKPAAAPTPPQSGDEELYEPVGTMPVVGDKVIVLEADGTPYNGDDAGKPQEVLSVHGRECVTGYCELKMEYFCAPHPLCKIQNRILKRTQAKTQALRDDVAMGRAWKCEGPDACYSWRAVNLGERWFDRPGKTKWFEGTPEEFYEVRYNHSDDRSHYVELHGPEAAAVIESCRQAMKL